MQTWLTPYISTVLATGTMGALLLVQILVLDFAGFKGKHRPGTPIVANHDDFLFRASRAHANTNESISAFILLALFGMLSSAPAGWLGMFAWIYVAARVGHMLCYYANVQLLRSVAFGIALVGLIGMLIAGISAWAT